MCRGNSRARSASELEDSQNIVELRFVRSSLRMHHIREMMVGGSSTRSSFNSEVFRLGSPSTRRSFDSKGYERPVTGDWYGEKEDMYVCPGVIAIPCSIPHSRCCISQAFCFCSLTPHWMIVIAMAVRMQTMIRNDIYFALSVDIFRHDKTIDVNS